VPVASNLSIHLNTLSANISRNIFFVKNRFDALLRLPHEAGPDAGNAAARSSSLPRPPSPTPSFNSHVSPLCLVGDDAKRSLLARAQRLAQENHVATRLGSSPYATPPRLRFPPLHPCAAGPRGLALAASPVPGARQCRCSFLSRRPGLKFTRCPAGGARGLVLAASPVPGAR
jgi:hypothetical protein